MCSTAHGQTIGTFVNTCTNNTLDQNNGIVQTVCASGNKNELDFYSEVDDQDYEIQYESGPCLPMVYTEITVTDSVGNTVFDSGLQSGTSSVTASGSIVPKVNESYIIIGAASAAASPDYSGACSTVNEGGYGVSVRVTAPPPQGTTATLTASPNPAQVGTNVQFIVQVSPSAATGVVSVYDAGNLVGSSSLVSGSATISTAALAVGLHSVTASYSGNSVYSSSTSPSTSLTIAPPPQGTTVTLTASPNPAQVGTNVQFIVQVSPSAATGVVSVYDAGNLVGSSSLVSGSATISTAALAVGVHSVTASYAGNSVYSSSTSSSTSLTIAPPTPAPIYSFSITDQNGNTGYAANGNITAYTDSVNGTWALSYDSMNRLTSSVAAPINSGAQYGCWAYDSFGNMQTQALSSQPITPTGNSCQTQGGAINLLSSYQYSASNQIASGQWLDANKNTHSGSPQYDAAGNMTSDLLNVYLYDADGRVCAVNTGGGITGYLYNAEGQRVAKGMLPSMTCDPTQLQVTSMYFIGPDGEAMTEVDGQGNWVRTEVSAAGLHLATYTPTGIHYPITDWLGSKRVVVNPNLALNNGVEETCTSNPFGDGLNCSTSIDASPRHFTGKERDTESGLDYFGARYYASSIGRFTSPDWSAQAEPVPYAKLADPQSLNLYAYVRNNPLGAVDNDGHDENVDGAANPAYVANWNNRNLKDYSSLSSAFSLVEPNPDYDPNLDPAAQQQSTADKALTKVADAADAMGMNTPGMQSAIDHIGTFAAGAGDFLSFGITKKINDADGGSDFIDYGSKTYTAGKVTGIGITVTGAVAGGLTAGALKEGKGIGGIFGKGGAARGGLLNSNKFVRFGWSWEGSAQAGRNVIRIGIGEAGSWIHIHIPVWYP
jgi:RHS repeat-associated protein